MTLNDRRSQPPVKVGTFGVNWVTNNIDPRGGGEKVEVAAMVVVVVVVVVVVIDSSRVCTRRLLAPSTILRFSITRLSRESHPQIAHDVVHGRFPFQPEVSPNSRYRQVATLRDNLEEKITVIAMSMRDYLSLLGATISDNGRSNNKISQMQIASREAFRCAFDVNVKKNVKSNLTPKKMIT